jgi:hypothetical protein
MLSKKINLYGMLIIALVNIIVSLYLFVLNANFPLWVDDYSFTTHQLIHENFGFHKLNSIYNKALSSAHWNARIGEIFAIMLSNLNSYVVDFILSLNVLIFINIIHLDALFLLIILIMILILIRSFAYKYNHMKNIYVSLFASMSFFLSISLFIFSPYIASRTVLFQVFLIILSIGSLYMFLEQNNLFRRLIYGIILIGSLPLLNTLFDVYNFSKALNEEVIKRNAILLDAVNNPQANKIIYLVGPMLGTNKSLDKLNSKKGIKNYYLSEWFDEQWYLNVLKHHYNINNKLEILK